MRLLVASSHGYLYVYNLAMEEGGECILWRTHRFVFVMVLHYLFILKTFNRRLMFRLDGQTDVVDSPKPIKTKEVNANKLDKSLKTAETPTNKNLGN